MGVSWVISCFITGPGNSGEYSIYNGDEYDDGDDTF